MKAITTIILIIISINFSCGQGTLNPTSNNSKEDAIKEYKESIKNQVSIQNDTLKKGSNSNKIQHHMLTIRPDMDKMATMPEMHIDTITHYTMRIKKYKLDHIPQKQTKESLKNNLRKKSYPKFKKLNK